MNRRRQAGYFLLEMIVVMAIIMTLLAMAIPNIVAMRLSAQQNAARSLITMSGQSIWSYTNCITNHWTTPPCSGSLSIMGGWGGGPAWATAFPPTIGGGAWASGVPVSGYLTVAYVNGTPCAAWAGPTNACSNVATKGTWWLEAAPAVAGTGQAVFWMGQDYILRCGTVGPVASLPPC